MIIDKGSYFLFNGGEVHSKLPNDIRDATDIICIDYTMDGFMAICEYKEILARRGLAVNLTYPYFPYARQDRVMSTDEPFSLKIFCDLLNAQKFQRVTIWDPHSDVIAALVDNCRIFPQWEIARICIPSRYFTSQDSLFISPDAGAYKKLSKLVSDDSKIAIGVKKRDEFGKITHTDVFSPVPIEEKVCIIVDDICDGGRTFIELAKVLKSKGAQKVILYVTHGIFSQGLLELYKYIDHIYTTNSFPNAISSRLTVHDNL